jgi:hypothetical protein
VSLGEFTLQSFQADPTFVHLVASLRKPYVHPAPLSSTFRHPFSRLITRPDLQKKEAEEKIEQIKNSGGDMSADYKPPA